MGLAHREVIAADTKEAKRVLERIVSDAIVHTNEVGRSDLVNKIEFHVRMAIEETLMNHIKHGSQLDPSKHVTVEWEIEGGVIRVHSEDEGQGFDPDALPDPTDDEHRELASGRGVLLTREFARMFHGNVEYPNQSAC